MTKPQAFKLLADRFEHPAGTIVYKQLLHDYGLASDDTRETGVEHISVTLKPDGGYPGFTVPVDELQDLDEAQRAATDQAINDLKASGELRRREDARALRDQIERGAE